MPRNPRNKSCPKCPESRALPQNAATKVALDWPGSCRNKSRPKWRNKSCPGNRATKVAQNAATKVAPKWPGNRATKVAQNGATKVPQMPGSWRPGDIETQLQVTAPRGRNKEATLSLLTSAANFSGTEIHSSGSG